MQKTILTLLGSALIAATAVQAASAAERHRVHRGDRAQVRVSEPVRNANAYVPAPAWTNQSRWSNYDGALSAPAGR
jgi:hypothetical protein